MPENNHKLGGGDWYEWSKYLIEGMKAMRKDIDEIYRTLHDMDIHHDNERHKLINEITRELNAIRQEHQKDINNITLEMNKIQLKMAFWSSILATIGAAVGSLLIYVIKSWIFTNPHLLKPGP